MESTKRSALLLLAMLALSSSPVALAWEKAEPECYSCSPGGSPPSTGVPLPPVTVPPTVPLPSVPIPKVPVPPVTVPPVTVPPVTVPPVTVPPVTVPPVTVPPVVTLPPILPPITLPPIIGGSPPKTPGGRKGCPPPPSPPKPAPSSAKCPIDALKLGACVDVLGNQIHIGDAKVKCCPLVKGVAGLSAAACLCTAIKAKVLNLSVFVPIALEVLVNVCGADVPPGYKCA